MRFGVVLPPAVIREGSAALATEARRIEDLGFDFVWLAENEDHGVWDPFVAAAALAASTVSLRVVVEVPIGHRHPLQTAEDAAVCDLSLNGRLVVVVRPAHGGEAAASEALQLLFAAWRSRPFRHQGQHWTVPAHLDANSFGREQRIRVTPAPAQPELPVWTVDLELGDAFGISVVAPSLEGGASIWQRLDEGHGRRAERLPHPAVIEVSPEHFDHSDLVERLRDAERAWGLDTAVFRLSGDTADRPGLLSDLARLVRPRAQLDALPSGLAEVWDQLLT